MSDGRHLLEADSTWNGKRFESGLQVAIEHGTIVAVGKGLGRADQRLRRRALLPGFIDVHSHAFQRGLRGLGETFPEAAGSFWTWRQAMYGLVESLDADRLHHLSTQTFREMRAAGITTVGEFHYVHHRDPAQLDFALDDAILAAASEVGIRLSLLQTFYRTGGPGRPLEGAQRRFATPSIDAYWTQLDHLAERLGPHQTLGVVAHSFRAAEPSEIAELLAGARARGLPFHLHLEEQQREIEECVEHYGARPADLLLRLLDGAAGGVTAVHCTGTPAGLLEQLSAAGATLCLCPLTEANLGDGIPSLTDAPGAWDHLALGSDSNLRIDMLEQLRWLDYGQRLAQRARGLLRRHDGDVASLLLAAATTGGARSLGLPSGRIAPGHHADLVAIDLRAPALAGVRTENLAEALIYGAGSEVVAATAVAGVFQSAR